MRVLVYSRHNKDAYIERIPHNGMYIVMRYNGEASVGRILCDTLKGARYHAKAWINS